jgi:hypothetical protein
VADRAPGEHTSTLKLIEAMHGLVPLRDAARDAEPEADRLQADSVRAR